MGTNNPHFSYIYTVVICFQADGVLPFNLWQTYSTLFPNPWKMYKNLLKQYRLSTEPAPSMGLFSAFDGTLKYPGCSGVAEED